MLLVIENFAQLGLDPGRLKNHPSRGDLILVALVAPVVEDHPERAAPGLLRARVEDEPEGFDRLRTKGRLFLVFFFAWRAIIKEKKKTISHEKCEAKEGRQNIQ